MFGTTLRASVVAVAATAVAALSLATPASAVSSTIGNPAIEGTHTDVWTDFVVVDTNTPAAFDGYFTAINYYSGRVGTIQFIVVDSANVVTWVSDEITATEVGPQTATFVDPVGVTAGSNLAVYSKVAGVVMHVKTGDDAYFTPRDSGLPALGASLGFDALSPQERTYSMNAQIKASSPEICKNGGWESYPEYKNQGQCIASVVANANAGK